MPRIRKLIVVIVAVLLMGTGVAHAARGVLACVGRHSGELGNGLEATASFQLSNFSENATIEIDKVRVYVVGEGLVCVGPEDWPSSGFPSFPTTLGPNGGTWVSSWRLIAWCDSGVIPDPAWLILKIEWSSATRGLGVFPLFGRSTEIVRERIVPPGDVVPGLGRSSLKCDTVQYYPWRRPPED